jgi:Circularly permutated YpsA SLOG family
LLKIISGGQTGIDRGALDAARELGVEFGGWCPAGRVAEDGEIPESYRLQEMATQEYAMRTAANVRDSNGTLIICKGEPTGGTRATIEFCRRFGKPHLVIDCEQASLEEASKNALQFVRTLSFRTEPRNLTEVRQRRDQSRGSSLSRGMTIVLNVAGPRASQWPEGHGIAYKIVTTVLRRFSGHKGADE